MTKRKSRTQEEKEGLVKAFLKSELSLSKWCKENKIPITTFNGWMKKYENKVSFIQLEPTTKTSVEETEKLFKNEISIEFNEFKITITDHSSMHLLENVLKVVKNLNV